MERSYCCKRATRLLVLLDVGLLRIPRDCHRYCVTNVATVAICSVLKNVSWYWRISSPKTKIIFLWRKEKLCTWCPTRNTTRTGDMFVISPRINSDLCPPRSWEKKPTTISKVRSCLSCKFFSFFICCWDFRVKFNKFPYSLFFFSSRFISAWNFLDI